MAIFQKKIVGYVWSHVLRISEVFEIKCNLRCLRTVISFNCKLHSKQYSACYLLSLYCMQTKLFPSWRWCHYKFRILLFAEEQRTDWINNLSDITARNETEWHVKLSEYAPQPLSLTICSILSVLSVWCSQAHECWEVTAAWERSV